MANIIEGKLTARGKKIGIVASRFNELITHQLINGAKDCLLRHECKETDITVDWVPGSFEIAPVAKKMAKSQEHLYQFLIQFDNLSSSYSNFKSVSFKKKPCCSVLLNREPHFFQPDGVLISISFSF